MTFSDYIKDKLLLLALHLSCMMVLTAFLHVTNYPWPNICIILAVWLLILSVWFPAEYLRRRYYFRHMTDILENAEQKYLLGELMPQSFRLEDRLYRGMIRQSNKSVIEKIHSIEDAQSEYREYIESWVHEIKAPMADINLLCERLRQSTETDRKEIARHILLENQKTENCVDMALFYARSDEVYKDYLIRETALQQTAEDVVRRNKYDLIEKRIQVQVSCGHTAYTDTKWIAFILNQLILNAVKYCRDTEPKIRISTEKTGRGVLLTVADNGLGIPESELPRIFDKGFTGSNGRTSRRSTGMGLYLCGKLCAKLGIQISAESEEMVGTRITLAFPVSNYVSRL